LARRVDLARTAQARSDGGDRAARDRDVGDVLLVRRHDPAAADDEVERQAGSSPRKVCWSVPASCTDTTRSGRSPVLRKPCGVPGGTTSIWFGRSSATESPAVQRPSPSSMRNVSWYGCTCRSTPPPGGV